MSEQTSQISQDLPPQPLDTSREANSETQDNSLNPSAAAAAAINKVIKPKKKSKKLCQYKTCTSPHSIVGDCNFCFKKFCSRHRLLESHSCEHYREVQRDYHERNARQLQSQQTVVSKV